MADGNDVAVTFRQLPCSGGEVEVRVLPERQHQSLLEPRGFHAQLTPEQKQKQKSRKNVSSRDAFLKTKKQKNTKKIQKYKQKYKNAKQTQNESIL